MPVTRPVVEKNLAVTLVQPPSFVIVVNFGGV